MANKTNMQAMQAMVSSIYKIVRKIVKSESPCDRIFTAKVTEVISPTQCKVLYSGKTLTVSTVNSCKVNDLVRVCAPSNNWTDLFIVENKTSKSITEIANQNTLNITKNTNAIAENANAIAKLNGETTKYKDMSFEQNSTTEHVRNYFMQLTDSVSTLYNSSGAEWGYVFFKRANVNGMYGCILRISSMNGEIQTMFKNNTTWSDWITK